MSAERAMPAPPISNPRTEGADAFASAEQPQINLVRLVHRNLRGRYILTGALAALCGLAGAAAGYFLPTPKYRSEGWLDVRSTIVQASSDQTNIMPMFTNFVNKQVRLLQDDRVIQRAMNSEEWRAFNRPTGPEALLDFKANLTVGTSREAQDLILISFTDQRPDAALHGLRQCVIAYQAIYGEQSSEKAKAAQTQVLGDQIKKLTDTKRGIQKDIALSSEEFATAYGSDDVAQLSERVSKQLFDLKDRVASVRNSLLERNVDLDQIDPSPTKQDAADPKGATPTADELARTNGDIASLLEFRNRSRRQLDLIIAKGRLPQHPERLRAEIELDQLEQELQSRVADAIANPKAAPPLANNIAPVASISDLKATYNRMKGQAEDLGKLATRVNRDRNRITALQSQLKETETELDSVTSRIEKMALDSAVEQRIGRVEANIPDKNDVPTILNADPRRKYAAFGLIAGAGLPVALIFLFGLADRRYRYADDADGQHGSSRLLGILPDLPTNSEDPETAAAAVHSVHHIRSRLQLGGPGHQVYMVTSPTSGDGKTSLSLSLAVSFTASGSNVLLIDFDLIGHGLSSQLGLCSTHGIGKKLVSGDPADPVVETQVPGLSLIAAGSEDEAAASRISRRSFADLIETMRKRFDVVIIDTGPILGSLEANLAASLADGVIIVVRRGQHGSYMQEATAHLRQMNARITGFVFNRARTADFNRSSAVNGSFRSVRTDPGTAAQTKPPAPTQPADSPALGRLGTLARRVALDVRR